MAKTPEGEPLFDDTEYLTSLQIQSHFNRLAVLQKKEKDGANKDNREEDALIEEQEQENQEIDVNDFPMQQDLDYEKITEKIPDII